MASSIDASTSGAGGVITTADNTGILQLKSGGTTIATVSSTGLALNTGNITLPSGAAPAFSAYLNTDQSISLTTWTKVQFNTELFDTNNNFDSTTNYRFTPTVAGYYQINFVVGGLSGNGRAFIGAIYKNGSILVKSGIYMPSAGQLDDGSLSISHLIYFNGSSDYVEFYAYQDGGTGMIFNGNPSSSNYTVASGFLARSA